MKPVTQEFLHDLSAGQYGDCQRAVLAALLELPISEVPHFLQDAKGEPVQYWESIQAFCRGHGFVYLTVPARAGVAFYGDDGDVYHEISGPSPRHPGTFHAVVGNNGQIAFDPHPSRAGLSGDPAEWEHAYLVRVGARQYQPSEVCRLCAGSGCRYCNTAQSAPTTDGGGTA